MAAIARKDKTFSITGSVDFSKPGHDKNGNPYFLLTVAGVTFFLPAELHTEAKYLEDGQRVTIKGETAGQTVRNGQRQSVLEVYEIIPGGELDRVPSAVSHGINGLSKAQPA
jgi:hypothetical protein